MQNQKQRGNRYERQVIKYVYELFGLKAKTCRAESKALDDAKIDICNIPYNIQCKYGKQRGIKYNELLADIKRLNPKRNYPTIIFHAKDRRKEENEIVIMTYRDFKQLLTQAANGLVHNKSFEGELTEGNR
jgi:hypothetical protein